MTNTSLAVAEATIDFLAEREGGLRAAMPSGTRSILVGFGEASAPDTTAVDGWFGAVIETLDGAQLRPGSERVAVRIEMWAAEAALSAAVLDAPFSLWYGRVVGRGRVTSAATLDSHSVA